MMDGLRLAELDDLAAVEAIVREAYSPYIARIGRPPAPMLDDYPALIGERRVHVAEREGVVQGVLVLLPRDDALLLDNVAVASAARGRGLGRAMLVFAERAAVASGYRFVRLYTNVAMTENIALYSRIGYRISHEADELGLHRVHMIKPVGGDSGAEGPDSR
jgi:ribosomal protein S18 acetylase RimI-like enzyme